MISSLNSKILKQWLLVVIVSTCNIGVPANSALVDENFPGVGSEIDWRKACSLSAQAENLKPEDAMSLYQKSVNLYPYDWRIYYNLGLAYAKLKNFSLAEDAYKRTIELQIEKQQKKPERVVQRQMSRTFCSLAMAQEKLGEISESELNYKKAIHGSSKYWEDYASFLRRQNRLKEAKHALTESQRNNRLQFTPLDSPLGRSF